MEIITTAISIKIKLMASVNMFIQMDRNTLGNGAKTSSMEREKKSWRMAPSSKDSSRMA